MASQLMKTTYSLIAFVLIIVIIQRVRLWLRLRHIPGPPGTGFSKFWLLRHTLGGRIHFVLQEAAEKYGSLVRIGPNELITSDPDVWRHFLGTQSRYRRSTWFDGARLDPNHDNIVSQRDDKLHAELRAKLAIGYSGKEIEHFEESVDNNVINFIQLLERKYLSTEDVYKPCDFAKKSQFFTIDVITDIAFGKPFGDLTQDKDVHSHIQTTERSLWSVNVVGVLPWLHRLLRSRVVRSLLPPEKDPIGLGKVIGISKEIVAKRFGPDKKVRRDMLGSFIRHGLTQREAEAETLMQIMAGSDSSASAIRLIMLYIITCPRIEAALLAEISAASISTPIKDAEARKLPYLQAVIKEGLRVYPPASILGYREVPSGGETINGFFVPEDTMLGYNFFGMTRDPKLWGEDANLFRPERWLTGSEERLRRMAANTELVFSYGKWQCLGKNLAMMELNKVFVELLRNFEFTIVDPIHPVKLFTWSVHMASDMWMRITKREPAL